jgi:chromosome segregation ATPase
MKTYYAIALLAIFLTFGCNQKEKNEIDRLNKEVQSYKAQTQTKDSSINEILQSLNQIESNLSVIKEKEAVISVKTSANKEMSTDVRSHINDDILTINELMTKNKKEISRLHHLLKNSNLKIAELQKMVSQLNKQIALRDSQIVNLKDDLTKLHFSVAALNASLDTIRTERAALRSEKAQLQANVEDKTNSLNTAYYVIGTKKQLIEDNIVAKTGGLFSSTTKFKQDFNESKFKKVDVRQLSEISLNSKKVTIVTTHPSGSYQLQTNANGVVEKLKITNAEKFWSASKYLVITAE